MGPDPAVRGRATAALCPKQGKARWLRDPR